MRVTVYYFAVLREHVGRRNQVVEIGSSMTVSALYQQIFAGCRQVGLPVMYAVNQKYVDAAHALQDGDEVAFIPPLGGG